MGLQRVFIGEHYGSSEMARGRKKELICRYCGGPRELVAEGRLRCKPCHRKKNRVSSLTLEQRQRKNEREREYKKLRPKRDYKVIRFQRHNLSPESYQAMLCKQNYCCALCLQPFSINETPVIDHDHETQENRGLLHRTCNAALGLFGDNLEILKLAVQYLENFKSH